jgi:hypothetical protein
MDASTTAPRKYPTGKQAIVAFRRTLYPVSRAGLFAMMELTRGRVDREAAIGFVLRQEGYEIRPEECAAP